jgi:hypothetical protein
MKFRVQRRVTAESDPIAEASRASSERPISSRRKKGELTAGGRLLLGLFFSVFLLVGVWATYSFALKPWLGVWAARDWVPVTCQIRSSEVRQHDGDSTTYSVAITYSYVVDGREYTGDRYDFTAGSSSGRKAKKAIVARYRVGAESLCYVNPANPQEAVLERTRVRDWGFGLIPLVFVLVGAGGVYFALFGQRKTSGVGDEGAHSDRWSVRAARFKRETSTSTKAVTGDPASRSTLDGPVTLTPTESRVGKTVGIGIFALFWNWIVSVFVVNLVGDAWGGAWVLWLFVLFLVPFVGIGLFLIGLVVRQLMALANPVPQLTVNRGAFAPGDTLELSWQFEGRRTRLQSVRLFLEGREEATYRRGTDTKTDREVFATFEIAATSGLSAGEPAHAKLRLPERMMHSFKADNNRIVWSLRVKGEVPRWPDVDEAFELLIVPPTRPAAVLSAPPSSLNS